MNYFYILLLFSFTNQEFLLISKNYSQHIYCNDQLYIKINSIQYFYNKYNCTIALPHDNTMNICSNQSSCVINLKPFLFSHNRHSTTACRMIKLKSIRVNYTCVNDTFRSIHILNQPKNNYTKNTILLCLCIIIVVSLLAVICSYLRHFSIDEQRNSNMTRNIHTEVIYDHQTKPEYELKNFLVVESSSSSTLTSLNNKNLLTNPSEYDNLIKNPFQFSEQKVKFNDNNSFQ